MQPMLPKPSRLLGHFLKRRKEKHPRSESRPAPDVAVFAFAVAFAVAFAFAPYPSRWGPPEKTNGRNRGCLAVDAWEG